MVNFLQGCHLLHAWNGAVSMDRANHEVKPHSVLEVFLATLTARMPWDIGISDRDRICDKQQRWVVGLLPAVVMRHTTPKVVLPGLRETTHRLVSRWDMRRLLRDIQ